MSGGYTVRCILWRCPVISFVVTTIEGSIDYLVSKLVSKGYSVGPLGSGESGGKMRGEVSCVGSLKVDGDDGDVKKLLTASKEIFKEGGFTYHTIIVFNALTATTWSGSNIELPKTNTKTAYDHLTEDAGVTLEGAPRPQSSPEPTTP